MKQRTRFLGALLFATAACGVRVFDRWRGEPVVAREIAAPVPILWRHISGRAGELDLVLAKIRSEEFVLEFDWVTVPGDGRLYLRCAEAGTIGNASIRPRIQLRPSATGSALVIETKVRATTTEACTSTGHFERWLLNRLEPAIQQAVTSAAAHPGQE